MDLRGQVFYRNLVINLKILCDDNDFDPGPKLVAIAVVHVIVFEVRAKKAPENIAHLL